jgi:hypothetical protein
MPPKPRIRTRKRNAVLEIKDHPAEVVKERNAEKVVAAVLEPLSPTARRRVVDSILARFEMPS